MNFFRWFFSVKTRHRAGIRRYEKGGAGMRIVTIVVILAAVGAALGLEIWAGSVFENSVIGGIAVFILAIVFAIAAMELGLVYAVVAIRMFLWGVVSRAAAREAEQNGTEPAAEDKKTHRALDMVVFLIGLAVALGTIIAFIAVAVHTYA